MNNLSNQNSLETYFNWDFNSWETSRFYVNSKSQIRFLSSNHYYCIIVIIIIIIIIIITTTTTTIQKLQNYSQIYASMNCSVHKSLHCLKSLEFFWSVFSRIRTEYGEMWSISPYSVRMGENTDQKKSKYGHFSGSVIDKYFCSSCHLFFSKSIDTECIISFGCTFQDFRSRRNSLGTLLRHLCELSVPIGSRVFF